MSLANDLANRVLVEHPDRAALVLERIGHTEALRVLEKAPVHCISAVIGCLSPQYAATLLQHVEPARLSEIVSSVSVDAGARLLRRVDEGLRTAALDVLEPKQARSLRALLRFPEGSAGALMDPDVLALPQELTAREAMKRVRSTPEFARYNLYVVDSGQHLIGTLNLRELLIASSARTLCDLMVRDPLRIEAGADRAAVMVHRGWKVAHALPVVDEDDIYLGAIRYRTLRELEGEILNRGLQDFDTSSAIAELLGATASGLVDAVAGSRRERSGDRHGR